MAKGKRNSGKFQQDAIVGKFKRDARSNDSGAAWRQCKASSLTEKVEKVANTRVSPAFLATGK